MCVSMMYVKENEKPAAIAFFFLPRIERDTGFVDSTKSKCVQE